MVLWMIAHAFFAMGPKETLNCLGPGDLISGEYRFVESSHPNGTYIRSGFLRTLRPFCVEGSSPETGEIFQVEGRWIQVSWADDETDRPYAGDMVEIEADCFEPISAWHLGDIVCIDARLISIR
ncbi:MAG: hypothetical protein ACK4E3_08490 [Brevundimonas sp.]|jgi:hypothetical protein|uniref:hypothetical protein n=1 Tax=Brevundimonas sp. TaxID=1871086 RepID=UPI0039196748